MPASLRPLILACLAVGALSGAWAQPSAGTAIYTCVDAKGRRLTSDRPIAECLDREQKELNPSGTVRRTLRPTLTAAELAAQEERDRRAADDQQRQAEERRLDRALMTRYPNVEVHDAERAKALEAVEQAIASGRRRVGDLREQRAKLQAEAEFHKTPAQWPSQLKRQLDDNEQQMTAQQRFIAGQDEEKTRIRARYDEELGKLKRLWARGGATSATGATTSASR